jgi:putative membrane protein
MSLYLFFKWLHLVGAISWVAGVLYVIRMLVLLADAGHKPDVREVLVASGLRAHRIVSVPPMVITFAGGLGMMGVNPGVLAGWLYVKLALLLALAGGTGFAGARLKRYAKGEHALPSGLAMRLLNELPAILMLAIVALAVFRPF